MSELSRYFFLLGGLPYIIFGIVHALMTPVTPNQMKALTPRDPAFRTAMSREVFLLTRRTNLWLCWVGFNFSHSLGLVAFGIVVLSIGRSQASFVDQATIFVPLAVVVSLLYLVLGLRYWFRSPILVTTFACACFVVSWLTA